MAMTAFSVHHIIFCSLEILPFQSPCGHSEGRRYLRLLHQEYFHNRHIGVLLSFRSPLLDEATETGVLGRFSIL